MADVVHILHGGASLCGKPGVPGDWGPGHKWVARDTDALGERSLANCPACLAGYQVWTDDPDRLPEYVAAQRAAHFTLAPDPVEFALAFQWGLVIRYAASLCLSRRVIGVGRAELTTGTATLHFECRQGGPAVRREWVVSWPEVEQATEPGAWQLSMARAVDALVAEGKAG